jgi:hypothetical protein
LAIKKKISEAETTNSNLKAKLDQLQKERVKGASSEGWPTPIEEGKGPMKF